jgi:DNA-binding response OmpR family regulator
MPEMHMDTAANNDRSPNRRRYLVAEDDPDVRAFLAEVLRQDGGEVTEAEDGAELLAWAELSVGECRLFDAIISDIQMPGLTALDVMRRVRTMTRTPVILVTAFADREIRAEAYDLGAEIVVSKPLHPRDLRAFARAVTRRPSAI